MLSRFRKWLERAGAEVLEPTNEYEVLRFRARGRVSIVYRREHGEISRWTGDSGSAFDHFANGKPWDAGVRRKRKARKPQEVAALLRRDGRACFYCGGQIEDGRESLEHVVPVARGGPHHLANLVLTHPKCNHEAGDLSAAEKVRLRDRKRSA